MQKYKAVRDRNGCQMVQDQTCIELIYITANSYAKMAEVNLATVEQKASAELDKGVIDLGIDGVNRIEGRYLVPLNLVFIWLMSDAPEKAVIIGTEAVAESIRDRFYELNVFGSMANWNVNE